MKFTQREVLENKFLEYGETTFYIMVLSCLVIVSAVPIITIGAALTAAYATFDRIEKRDGSISLKELISVFFKTFVKRFLPATGATIWIIGIGAFIRIFSRNVNGNIFILALLIFIAIECAIFFQVIFYVIAKGEYSYLEAIKKALYIGNYKINKSILLIMILSIIVVIVAYKAWMIILGVGLHVFINNKVLSKIA
jgi:hypothetical protein